jgi:hypothetical protein
MGFHKKLNHIVEVGSPVFKVVAKFNPSDPPPTSSPPPSVPLLVSIVRPASWSTECKIEVIHQTNYAKRE